MRPITVTFGTAVRSLRRERGVSQEELGNRAGLHRNHVGQIERGELSPTLDTIDAIATALAVAPSDLVAHAESFGDR